MKPYGHKRHDQIACIYGCCTTSYGKKKNCRSFADSKRRKTARQEGKRQIFTSLLAQ